MATKGKKLSKAHRTAIRVGIAKARAAKARREVVEIPLEAFDVPMRTAGTEQHDDAQLLGALIVAVFEALKRRGQA